MFRRTGAPSSFAETKRGSRVSDRGARGGTVGSRSARRAHTTAGVPTIDDVAHRRREFAAVDEAHRQDLQRWKHFLAPSTIRQASSSRRDNLVHVITEYAPCMRMALLLLVACGSLKPPLSRGERALRVSTESVSGAIAAGNVAGIAFEGIEPGMNADAAVATAPVRFHASLCKGTPVTTSGMTVHYEGDCIALNWGRFSGAFDVTWEDSTNGLRAHIVAPKELWQSSAANTWIDRLEVSRPDRLMIIDTTTRIGWGPNGERGNTIVEGHYTYDSGPSLQGTLAVKSGKLTGTVKVDYHEELVTNCPVDGRIESRIDGIDITETWKRNDGPEYRPLYARDTSDGTPHHESLVDCQWGSCIGPH